MRRESRRERIKKDGKRGKFIYAEGNNGGDFIKIQYAGEGLVKLESGSCCVYSIKSLVPVEILTGILANTMLEHNYNIDSVIDSLRWDKAFKEELKSKIKKLNFHGYTEEEWNGITKDIEKTKTKGDILF